MANVYINIAHLYKRMPVLTDTNGDHLISVSDLRTAIAMAAAETGEVHPMPCKIGSKIYEVTGEPGEQIDIDEHTVSEVGLNGVFIHGGILGLRHRHYFAYEDEGVWWFFKREDAEAEKKRRNDP
jgi:hypothetical protein